MKYIIILAITMSSCVIREKRCCEPTDCIPRTKKVIVDTIDIKHIPTHEEYMDSALRAIRLYIKKQEIELKILKHNQNKIRINKDKIKSYHELQTRSNSVHIKHNFNSDSSSNARNRSIDTNIN